MAERSVYKSSTLGDIPLSFTGRQLLQQLRIEVEDLIKKVYDNGHADGAQNARKFAAPGKDWEPLSRARARLAQYMSKLERKSDSPERDEDAAFPPHFVGDRSYKCIQDEIDDARRQGVEQGRAQERLRMKTKLNSLYGEFAQYNPTLDPRTAHLADHVRSGRMPDHPPYVGAPWTPKNERCIPAAMLKNRVEERLLEFRCGIYEVRLWLDCSTPLYDDGWYFKRVDEKYAMISNEGHRKFQEQLTKEIANIPGLSAVQVKKGEASVLIYPDWK